MNEPKDTYGISIELGNGQPKLLVRADTTSYEKLSITLTEKNIDYLVKLLSVAKGFIRKDGV